MSEGTENRRTARLLTLIAGNGYVFVQVYNRIASAMEAHDPSAMRGSYLFLTLISLVGVSGAYVGLFWPATRHRTQQLELLSIICLMTALSFWIGFFTAYWDYPGAPVPAH